MSQATGFRVGAEFSSYSELHREYRRYQRDFAVQMWTRHSRTIDAQRRRAPKRPMNDALKFAEIDYACIHGGKLFRTKGAGRRPIQRTNKMKCPCVIKVRLSADGDKFVVKEMNESHNHTVQQEEQERFPRQRRFDKAVREEAPSGLALQGDHVDEQEHLEAMADQAIHREEQHAIARKDKWGAYKVHRTDLEMMVPALAAVKDGTVVVVVSKASVLQAIYFQDSSMKQTFEKYPEVLLMDATYRWEGLRLPTYLLLVIDGNGESELVCLWFLQNEERETLKQLLRIFKQKNPAAERVQVVMSSGRAGRGEVVSEVLPQTRLLTCLCQALCTFRGEVTPDKMNVTVGQRNLLLQIFHNMCYAASAEEYDLLYQQLLDTNTQQAIDYFHQNWHETRSQWVEGLKHESESYLTSTVNRVESLSQKLRALVGTFADSASFVRDLLKAVDSLRTECDYRAVRMFQKVPPAATAAAPDTGSVPTAAAAAAYSSLLTHFAFTRVQRELEDAQWVTFLSAEAERAEPLCRRRSVVTAPASCQCAFHTAMRLPCRHILAFRQLRGCDLFEPALCSSRWTREHFLRDHPVFRPAAEPAEPEPEPPVESVAEPAEPEPQPAAAAGSPLQPPESPRDPETVQQERYLQALK